MLFSLWQYRHDITEILLKVALNIINLNLLQFQEEFEDTKRVMRIRKSRKTKQHNDQKEKAQKNKQRSIKHTHKTKDPVTQRNRHSASFMHIH
jgi:hypothetical protein